MRVVTEVWSSDGGFGLAKEMEPRLFNGSTELVLEVIHQDKV